MRLPFAFALALCVFPGVLTAQADTPIDVTDGVTAYSGNCKYDRYGGGTKTSDGTIFKNHTVENPGDGYAVAAVPQNKPAKRGKRKGQVSETAGIFRCLFTDPDNYPGTTFRAADHYGTSSNGLEKYDAGHTCQPGLVGMSKPPTTIIVKGNCGSVKGGAGDRFDRKFKDSRVLRSAGAQSS